ncbi:hypothetical protein Slu03_20600 [Sediminihabitans luteus]|nr:hypothetical protein Slu03_20600 [Sediminihabitans luteus]
MSGARVTGVVLAAGAGRRYGAPKALAREADGVPWLVTACATLRAGGIDDVTVVLGAQADDGARLVPADVRTVRATGWERGLSASLAAALADVAGRADPPDAVLLTLVDLPGLRPEAVRRVLRAGAVRSSAGRPRSEARGDECRETPEAPERGATAALARATYGAPGHPVLVGRAHWAPLAATLDGDVGAGPYLRAHGVVEVDCADLGGGHDVDVPGGATSGTTC